MGLLFSHGDSWLEFGTLALLFPAGHQTCLVSTWGNGGLRWERWWVRLVRDGWLSDKLCQINSSQSHSIHPWWDLTWFTSLICSFFLSRIQRCHTWRLSARSLGVKHFWFFLRGPQITAYFTNIWIFKDTLYFFLDLEVTFIKHFLFARHRAGHFSHELAPFGFR